MATEYQIKAEIDEASFKKMGALAQGLDMWSFIDEGTSAQAGMHAISVNLVQVSSDRIPIGAWNYYPDHGMFSPSQRAEDTLAYDFLKLSKWGLERASWLEFGKAIAEILAHPWSEDEVRTIVEGALGDLVTGPIIHPLISFLETALQKREVKKKDTLDYDWNFWSTLLAKGTSLFTLPMKLYPSNQVDYTEEEIMMPLVLIPRPFTVSNQENPVYTKQDEDLLITQVGLSQNSTKTEFHFGKFTAMYRTGIDQHLSDQEVAAVNAVELIKGDREGFIYEPGPNSAFPALQESDMVLMREEMQRDGFMSGQFARHFLDKAQKNPGFSKATVFATALNKISSVTGDGDDIQPRMTTDQIWIQLTKVLAQGMKEFRKIK